MFFTDVAEYENKVATWNCNWSHRMLRQIHTVLARSRATLLVDMIGGGALMLSLLALLWLPAPF